MNKNRTGGSRVFQLDVGAPRNFSLDALVASHGWYQLRPFRFDPASRALETVLRLSGDRTAEVRLTRTKNGGVSATTARPLVARDRAFAQERVARMLHLDAPLDAFHRLCRSDASLRWIAKLGLGRLLRAQDLWEDHDFMCPSMFLRCIATSAARSAVAKVFLYDMRSRYTSGSE